MKYLLLVCSDDVAEPEKDAVVEAEVPKWIDEMDGRGVRLLGRPLHARDAAATVRVREGATIVTDGPFSESKEWIGGFDILDCADLDEAIEVASKHPLAQFHEVEIRPFWDGFELSETAAEYARGDSSGDPAYLMLMFLDGIAGDPETEASVRGDGNAWAAELESRGKQILGYPLQHKDVATTVQVRNGETLVSDGPFVETTEFIGGIDLVRCASREEAIEIAAQHPLARVHAVEVRAIREG